MSKLAFCLTLCLVLALAAAGWVAYIVWPRRLAFDLVSPVPVCQLDDGQADVRLPGRSLIAEAGQYRDELFAYLMFGYLRSRPAFKDTEVLITYQRRDGVITYPIYLVLPNNLLTSIPMLDGIARRFPFLAPDWRYASQSVVLEMRSHTRTFNIAYSFPAYRPLHALSRQEIVAYMERFIRFKSSIDPRATEGAEPPGPLSPAEARQLSEDIVTVAHFYSLPLDLFLGIGAMENNFLNVKGDLDHAVWKRRAQKGDVVLRRRGGKVLVLDQASGVWQITRETLRYVHALYLKDKRDYSKLPARLRPPKKLNLDEISPGVLTTYAGLLFRTLLDRFHGDVAKAVGAYNGGPGNPNEQYEAGVRLVAEYARRVMEQAAILRGQSVAGMRLLEPAPGHAK